uniref:Uncharacterized protein n=1 Tax=Anguilla anguilla TaxID=7936 RepID=A0A0E9SYG4_ANGAN
MYGTYFIAPSFVSEAHSCMKQNEFEFYEDVCSEIYCRCAEAEMNLKHWNANRTLQRIVSIPVFASFLQR